MVIVSQKSAIISRIDSVLEPSSTKNEKSAEPEKILSSKRPLLTSKPMPMNKPVLTTKPTKTENMVISKSNNKLANFTVPAMEDSAKP